MKFIRYFFVLSLLIIVFLLQACGSGGGTSDTAGSLTISTPTSTDNKDGSFSVTATVTYTPPAGKTAQGVVVTTTFTDSFGNVKPYTATLTSGSNSVIYSYRVFQSVGSSSTLSIVSNIGGMVAGVSVVVPAITPLSATAIQFKATDAGGTALSSAITGGVLPYSVDIPATNLLSPTIADLTYTLNGTTLNVTLNNTPSLLTPVARSATIIIIDSLLNSVSVSVKYFI